jgi:hypothetical protein
VAQEGKSNVRPGRGRFHVTADNRLFVFFYVSGRDAGGQPVSENRLLEIRADGTPSAAVRVPLAKPFSHFFSATVRAGSPPSSTLELLGNQEGASHTISFARIRLE